MKVIVFGADGYLGWPLSLFFADKGYDVLAVDNYLRRKLCRKTNSNPLIINSYLPSRINLFNKLTNRNIQYKRGDLKEYKFVCDLIKKQKPDFVVHLAEQPSAPYSMIGFEQSDLTLQNNLIVTNNIASSIINYSPDTHLIKLGTMGEYGTPNIDIEEGWININHNGRSDKFLYPRQASSFYHTTKILDTDLLWFYVRIYGLKVTDLMQGPVYGMLTKQTRLTDKLLPNFNYDDIFGTVLNRFLVQAIAGIPLTVYGKGLQKRGFINITDSLECIKLAADNPPNPGVMNIFNQFTESLSINDLALIVKESAQKIGIDVRIKNIDNPRIEKEDHYYNPKNNSFFDLGLKPSLLSENVCIELLNLILKYKNYINNDLIYPRVNWNV